MRILLGFLVFALAPLTSGAEVVGGARLVQGWREFTNWKSGQDSKSDEAAWYANYVRGAYHSLVREGAIAKPSGEVSEIQIAMGVGMWIDKNPNELGKPADELVREALTSIYHEKPDPGERGDTNDQSKANSFAGTWDTTSGLLTLRQDGDRVTGDYRGNSTGTIEGRIKDGRLEYTWKQTNGDWGAGMFRLTDGGNSIGGTWGRENSAEGGGEWTGKRSSANWAPREAWRLPPAAEKLQHAYIRGFQVAIKPLQARYVSDLRKLHADLTRAGKQEDAGAVQQEIERVENDATGLAVWHFIGRWNAPKGVLEIAVNRKASHGGNSATWAIQRNKLVLVWSNGFQHEYLLSQTGDTVQGTEIAPDGRRKPITLKRIR